MERHPDDHPILALLSIVVSCAALGCGAPPMCGDRCRDGALPPDLAAPDLTMASDGGLDGGSDGGAIWTSQVVMQGGLVGVWGNDADSVFAVGHQGSTSTLIVHSGDHGQSWQEQPTGLPGDLLGVWGSDASHVYAVGSGNQIAAILRTTNGGQSWPAGTEPAPRDLFDVTGRGGLIAAIGFVPASVLLSADQAMTWTASALPTTDNVLGIWIAESGRIWASGARSFLASSDDGGQSWIKHTVSGNLYFLHVWGIGADVFVVGDFGFAAHSADAGTTWIVLATPTMDGLVSIWGTSASDFYVGGNLTLLHTTDGGLTWVTELPLANDQGLYDVWGSGANDVYAVGVQGAAPQLALVWHKHFP